MSARARARTNSFNVAGRPKLGRPRPADGALQNDWEVEAPYERLRRPSLATRILQPEPYTKCQVFTFLFYAVLVGGIAGAGAFAFRALIAFFHNVLFLWGDMSKQPKNSNCDPLPRDSIFCYDANRHTPLMTEDGTNHSGGDPAIWLVIISPVLGAAVVAILVKNFAREARGHGVPEVLTSIHGAAEGKIRWIVAIIKIVASAVSIGSGASIGREGPIVQIGCTFGSVLADIARIPEEMRVTLLAAGGAGGIAATFNAPVGGVMFALELLLLCINTFNIVLVTVAVVVAIVTGQYLMGSYPAFDLELITHAQDWSRQMTVETTALFIPLAVIIAIISAVFIGGIYLFEELFEKIEERLPEKLQYYLPHSLGMLIVGIILFLLAKYTGHYYVQGVGYATIYDILMEHPESEEYTIPTYIIAILCVTKLFVTAMALGSGASGGVFSPGLFVGAMAGELYARMWELSYGIGKLPVPRPMFAVAGMSATVAASTGALFTAVIMCLEMTDYYSTTMHLMTCSAIALFGRQQILALSIYTIKMSRKAEEGMVIQDDLTPMFRSSPRISRRLRHNRAANPSFSQATWKHPWAGAPA